MYFFFALDEIMKKRPLIGWINGRFFIVFLELLIEWIYLIPSFLRISFGMAFL